MRTSSQTTDTLLMVRPANFGYNEETADSNAFQTNDPSLKKSTVRELAEAEFDAFVAKLRSAEIEVIVIQDTAEPVKTDAVFPNNWISLHADGTVVTYPMLSFVRRLERRADILECLQRDFTITRHLALEAAEEEDRFLEGTGSMILDRVNGIAYACHSPRTDEGLLSEFCRAMGYRPVLFTAVDQEGQEIYHTNVMMALGEDLVVICMASVSDPGERAMLQIEFAATGKEIIEISYAQMMAFAGNMLQVRNRRGETFLVMSEQAYRSLFPGQIERIEQHTRILYSSLETIETYGGGSARCMMAEVFLPKKG